MPKPRALTYDELIKMGATPEQAGPSPMTLKQLEAMGAVPDAAFELERRGIVPPYGRRMDPRRAFVLGGAQGGTLKFADEIGGLTAAATAPPPVRLGPAFAPSPDDTPEQRRIKEEALAKQPAPQLSLATQVALADKSPFPGMAEDPLSYKSVRDSMRAEAAHAGQDRPGYYTAGELLGSAGAGVVSGAIPVLGATQPAGTAMKMLLGGPGLGAVEGLGGSNAPLGSGQSARDILLGAGMGAGGEALGAVVGKVAPGILRRSGEMLEKRGVDNARKVLTSGYGQLNRHMTSDAAPRIALEEKVIPLFGTTETAYKRLVPLAEEEGKRYGEIVARLEAAGVPGQKARDIASEFLDLSAADWKNSGANKSVANRYYGEAQNAENIADPFTGRLGIVQENEIKKRLQAEAQGEYMKAGPESPLGHAKKKSAAVYRIGEENAIDAGRVIPDSEYIYHVTPEANMSAIRQQGLRPDAPKIAEGGPHGDTQAVFLGEQSTVPTYEDLYGGKNLAVVRTSRHGLPGLVPDMASEGKAWMTPNAIPPERLQVRNAAGGWDDVVPGSTAKRIQDIDAFVPVKRRLGPLIEARDTAELGMQKFQSRTAGAMPGGLEITGALATGNPLPLLGGPLRAIAKERLPSLVARSQFGAGRGLQSLASRMSSSGNTLPFAGGMGSATARALGMQPESPPPPESPPESAEADFERWRLEQELRGKSRPSGGAPLRRLIKKGGK